MSISQMVLISRILILIAVGFGVLTIILFFAYDIRKIVFVLYGIGNREWFIKNGNGQTAKRKKKTPSKTEKLATGELDIDKNSVYANVDDYADTKSGYTQKISTSELEVAGSEYPMTVALDMYESGNIDMESGTVSLEGVELSIIQDITYMADIKEW